MVRVWLRPALAAFSRQTAAPVALKASSQHLLIAQRDAAIQVRSFSSKKDKSHDKKKTLRDKFVDIDEDPTELPPDVQFLNKEMREQEDKFDPRLLASLEHEDLILDDELSDDSDDDEELVEEEEGDEIDQLQSLLEGRDSDDENDENDFLDDDDLEGLEDDDEDDEESALTDAEWAAKYERQIARMESRNGMREVEDDRLYCELPNRDVALMLSTEGDLDGEGDDDDGEDDDEEWEQSDDEEEDQKDTAFKTWDQAAYYTPEMMNWMQPKEKRTPFVKGQDKPWKYFVRANHPDPVELAMDVDLLRLFISPTGRIRPRRFTGLTAKQQRQLARSVKISRQLALLPYLTRYPDPSPEQWRAMDEETMAKALADLENGEDEDDDDDDDEDWEMEEE